MEIFVPKIKKIETVEIPLPTADVPYYIPMVVPPSDLRDQEDEPVETVEETPEPPIIEVANLINFFLYTSDNIAPIVPEHPTTIQYNPLLF